MGLTIIQSEFRFLVDVLGMTEAEVYESGTGAYVLYASDSCRVLVEVDRGILSVELRSAERNIIERRKITLLEVVRRAGAPYPVSGASGQLGGDMSTDILAQAKTAAAMLKAHGEPYLRGNFTN